MINGAERIIGLYRRHAHLWAERRGDRLMEAHWLDRFRNLLPAKANVLDLGCGSGKPIARYLVEKGCEVTGVDSSPELIELCRESFPKSEWRVADMRELSLERRFHGIIAWDSFFHLGFDDQRQMFPIFRAHAAPDAALMFTSGPAHGEAIGEFEGESLYHASLASEEYKFLLSANGFEVVAHALEDPTCGKHTIWLARQR
jgi:SAM-dependent methyltransferase